MKFTLNQIADINIGYFFPKKAVSDRNSAISVVFISDISSKSSLTERPLTYRLPTVPKSSHFVRQGDILIQVKASPRVVYISKDFSNTIASANFVIVRGKTDKILNEYLAWFLNQNSVRQYFERSQQGQNTPTLSVKAIEGIEISLPSLTKQRQIVELIKAKSKYEELLNKIQGAHEKLIQALSRQEK